MKITRRQLRQLIIEAARTIIVDPEGVATPADQAFRSGREKDAAMARLNPKLGQLMDLDSQGGTSVGDDMRSDRIMARVLADTIPLEDESMRVEPLTSAEERAVDRLGYDSLIQDRETAETIFDIEDLIPLFKTKRGNKILERFGVMTDVHTFADLSADPTFADASQILGCKIEDLSILPQEHDEINKLFYQLMDHLVASNTGMKHVINYNTYYSYQLRGINFVYYGGFGGFGTIYFCGR